MGRVLHRLRWTWWTLTYSISVADESVAGITDGAFGGVAGLKTLRAGSIAGVALEMGRDILGEM